MRSIGVEIKIECRSCSSFIPINGLASTYECKNCLEVSDFGAKTIAHIVNEVIDRVIRENDNRLDITGNIIPYYVKGRHCLRLYGPEKPSFQGHTLDLNTLDAALSDGHIMLGTRKMGLRIPPGNFAPILRQVKYVLGEDEEIIQEMHGAGTAAEPVLFSCLSCGGALKVDGSSRILHCSYCGSNNFLPDALWLRFHPVSKVKRWYIILNN